MLYYRVPEKLDGKQLFKQAAKAPEGVTLYKPLTPNGWHLIAGELLTLAECRRMNAPIRLLQPVNVKRTEIYFFFGGRFPVSGATVTPAEV